MSMTDPDSRLPHPHPQRPAVPTTTWSTCPHPTSRRSSRASCASRATSRSTPTEPARVGQVLRVTLKYTEDRQPVIHGPQAHLHARPPHVRGLAARCRKVHGGMGTTIMSTSQRRDDRPRRAPAGRRRRARGVRVVIGHEPHRTSSPSQCPSGVEVSIEPGAGAREGPQGRARRAHRARHDRGAGGRPDAGHAAPPTAASTARCTASPAA